MLKAFMVMPPDRRSESSSWPVSVSSAKGSATCFSLAGKEVICR
jgi:hypothetical protein